jgi:hypothetical protein
MYAEDLSHDDGMLNKVLGAPTALIKSAAVAVFGNEPVPSSLEDLAADVEQPLFLIAAPNSANGEDLNRDYHAAAGANSTLWEIPEATHTDGIEARPEEYERRVVGFFDRELRG